MVICGLAYSKRASRRCGSPDGGVGTSLRGREAVISATGVHRCDEKPGTGCFTIVSILAHKRS